MIKEIFEAPRTTATILWTAAWGIIPALSITDHARVPATRERIAQAVKDGDRSDSARATEPGCEYWLEFRDRR